MNRYRVTYQRWFTGDLRLEVEAFTKADALELARDQFRVDREVKQESIRVEKKLQTMVTARKSHRKRATFWTRLIQDQVIRIQGV